MYEEWDEENIFQGSTSYQEVLERIEEQKREREEHIKRKQELLEKKR